MEQGKTIWEMVRDRWFGSKPAASASASAYDPLGLVIGEPFRVIESQYAGYDFVVTGLHEYSRQIGGRRFVFTDYALTAMKEFDPATALKFRLRVMPDEGGTRTSLLLRLFDDLAYNDGLEKVVRDTTKIFEVTYSEGDLDGRGATRHEGEKEVYSRVNGLSDSYKASVRITTGTGQPGRQQQATETIELEYWDYTREFSERGAVQRQFLFVEMNSRTGWFQIWQGEPYGGA